MAVRRIDDRSDHNSRQRLAEVQHAITIDITALKLA